MTKERGPGYSPSVPAPWCAQCFGPFRVDEAYVFSMAEGKPLAYQHVNCWNVQAKPETT